MDLVETVQTDCNDVLVFSWHILDPLIPNIHWMPQVQSENLSITNLFMATTEPTYKDYVQHDNSPSHKEQISSMKVAFETMIHSMNHITNAMFKIIF